MDFGSILVYGGIAVLLILVVAVLAMGYVKAPPDVAYIISGVAKEPRIVIGKAAFKIPFFERLDRLSLRLIKVDVKTQDSVPTAEYININVDSVVMAKIPAEKEMILKASRLFLNVREEVIGNSIVDVLEGNTREIVGSMKLRDMIGDRKALGEKVQENAKPDLEAMGIELLSFTVQSFSDRNGVIEDLGIENTAQIKKSASIAKAEAERDVAVASAEAQRKAAEAQADANKAIAEKQNEVLVKQAELKIIADNKKAEADAAYEIQKQAQRKTIGIAEVNADIAKEERNITLREREAAVREQELNATVRKQADAGLYEQQRNAEAELYKKQKEAEAALIIAQKEAEAIRLKGEAEAKAIEAKGKAEAAAMRQKADAYKEYGKAAVMDMLVGVLPEVAKSVAEPLGKIDKITIFGGGEGNTLGAVGGNVPQAIGYAFDAMKAATGVDMRDIVAANSITAKTQRNLNVSGGIDVGNTAVAQEIVEAEK